MGKAGIKGGGEWSKGGIEVRGMGKDQEKLDICQNPR